MCNAFVDIFSAEAASVAAANKLLFDGFKCFVEFFELLVVLLLIVAIGKITSLIALVLLELVLVVISDIDEKEEDEEETGDVEDEAVTDVIVGPLLFIEHWLLSSPLAPPSWLKHEDSKCLFRYDFNANVLWHR